MEGTEDEQFPPTTNEGEDDRESEDEDEIFERFSKMEASHQLYEHPSELI
jgi:hypothetical protein